MPQNSPDPTEILISPVADMIAETGRAVAEAQTRLGQANLELFKSLPEELRAIGLMPSWFEMNHVEIELKLAVHYEQSGKTSGGKTRSRLFAAPHNAKYQNAFQYSANGSSTLKISFAPSPPPLPLQQPEE